MIPNEPKMIPFVCYNDIVKYFIFFYCKKYTSKKVRFLFFTNKKEVEK